MMFPKRKFVCGNNKQGVKSISFIVFVILPTFMQTYTFANGQSVQKGIHINQRRSVGDLVKLRSEIASEIFNSKTSKRNEHRIEKKSSSSLLVKKENSPEISIMPFYSDLFYEEKNEPLPSTVSPFGSSDIVQQSWALLGKKAALSCNIKPKDPDEKLATVLWYRGSQGEPIFTYDARNKGNATLWSEEEPKGFGNRAHFQVQSPNAILYLENIAVNEGGIFRCRVDFQTAQTRNSLFNLTVVVPPGDPIMLDKKGKKIDSDLIGPLDEGSSLTLTCKTNGGYPLPNLTWYTKSADNSNDNEESEVNSLFQVRSKSFKDKNVEETLETESSIMIPVLTRDYYGKSYRCKAENNNVTAPASTNITIDMRLFPTSVELVRPEEPLSVSKAVVLVCKSIGSRPPATITWWKKGKFMGKAPEEYVHQDRETMSVSRMEFHPKASDNRKNVTCRAENTNIRGSAIEDTITLDVHYPPRVKLNLGNGIDRNRISEGQDVYMDCEIRANPRIYKVEWIHNNLRVDSSPQDGVRILAGGLSLVLQSISRRNSGNYSCIGYNLEGEDTSNSISINVMYKPECIKKDPVTLGVVTHRDAEILCRMKALPATTKFRWAFNNSFETNEVLSEKQGNNMRPEKKNQVAPYYYSNLKYQAKTEKDFGEVRCFATNELGESEHPCIFTLIPAGPPKVPAGCDVHNRTLKSSIVSCSKIRFGGGDQSEKQYFHMEVKDQQSGELLQNQTSSKPIFTIRKMAKISKGVKINIYSSNSFGRSKETVMLETSLSKVAELQSDKSAPKKISGGKKANKSSVDSDLDPELWTGVLMGLLITVLLLAFLIGFLVRLQANRARLQRYNQETSLATLTGENNPSNIISSSKDKLQKGDNLNKLSSENDSDYSKSGDKRHKDMMRLSQVPLSCASPTDPDVVQLHLPATGPSMTLSHTRDGFGRLNRKDVQKVGSSAQHSTFNLALMKRSFSGTNHNSLLRPLLQPSSSTGLEDRPPPPPAPTQLQHQQKRNGLFTRIQSHPNQNAFTSTFLRDPESISKYELDGSQRGGVANSINNCRSSDERRQNLTQSSAHKNISNNVTSASLQQRLHHIQQSSELATKHDVSMTVLTPPSNSYHPLTSPSSPSYFSTNSSSNMSNTGESSSSGNYGQNQSTYPRNQPYSRQQQTIGTPPNMTGMRQIPSERQLHSSRVSFIGQGGKPELFSTNSLFPKGSGNFLPSVRFTASSSSGLFHRNMNKDEMM